MSTDTDMLDVGINFCKNLFGFESKPDIHLGGHFWSNDEILTPYEVETLE